MVCKRGNTCKFVAQYKLTVLDLRLDSFAYQIWHNTSMCCCIKEVKDKTNADSEIGSHIKKQLSENPIYSYMAGLDRIEFLSMKFYLLLAFFFFNQK